MFYTIYQITNMVNGKVYIGKHQTSKLDDGYMGSGKLLLYAIRKYGLENFTKEVLFVFDTEIEMNQKEAELVTTDFCLNENTYNLLVGGQGGFGFINSNASLRIEKNQKARRITDKILLEKYGVTSPSQLPHVRKITSIQTKEKHTQGKLNHIYFHNRPDFREVLDKAAAPKAIAKRKETFIKIKHQQGQANSQFGTMWINDGTKDRKIPKVENIPLGWNIGRIKWTKKK